MNIFKFKARIVDKRTSKHSDNELITAQYKNKYYQKVFEYPTPYYKGENIYISRLYYLTNWKRI